MGEQKSSVTPWSVTGQVDYDRIIAEFGVEKITPAMKTKLTSLAKKSNFMIDRGIFFAHRDLNWIISEYEKKNKFFLYTGRAPSGPVHMGHIVPWLLTKWLQEVFDVDLWFQFPDEEKFLFKQELSFDQIQEFLKDNMLDVIALGFKPSKTHFLIDTQHASLMYPEACKVAKKITFSMVKSSFGLTEQSNIGSIFYTAMQTVPTFLPSILAKKEIPCLIPHAIDQDPHFRLTRDILPKLGHYKPASIQCSFLPSLSGPKTKMSSSNSENEAIFLSDTPDIVKKKINKYAFSGGKDTLEEHRKYGGNPDVDISFLYLKYLLEPDNKKLDKIEKDYRSGKLLSGELKALTIEKINTFLKEHQANKKKAEKQLSKFIFSAK